MSSEKGNEGVHYPGSVPVLSLVIMAKKVAPGGINVSPRDD